MFLVVDLDIYKYTNTKAKYLKTNLRLCKHFFVISKKTYTVRYIFELSL